MPGYEGGIDIRRDDGTLDCSLEWIARNGEVHFTVEVNSLYGLSRTIVDFTSAQAHEIGGAFREAARQAGPADGVVPMSVVPPGKNPQGRYHQDGLVSPESPGVVNPKGSVSVPNAHVPYLDSQPDKWTANDVGHVLGERD